MSDPFWSPTQAEIDAAQMTAFRKSVGIADDPSLWQWSVSEPAAFWRAVWDFSQVIASRPADAVLVDGDKMPGAKWFVGARLNFAENLLRRRDDCRALVFWNETGFQRSVTYAELFTQVAGVAEAFRSWGVTTGDRVAGFVPNMPDSIVAMLAAASLGAMWSSCSPDFGVAGVLDRFGQIAPKILVACDGYRYDGKEFDCLPRLREICERLPSVEKLLVITYLRSSPPLSELSNAVPWTDLKPGRDVPFAQLPFEHPLYVLFSSGTTGPPKCLVHTAGGILLQHQKELLLHCDVTPADRLFYFTTCGWMMWNWLVSGLAVGCELHLYDGSPLVAQNPSILFDMAQRERTTIFGTSPRFLSALAKAGLAPRKTHDLSALRSILSTGSPLLGEHYDYIAESVKPGIRVSSISGGTDLCSSFVLGNPAAPVYRGEIQTRGLGMNVHVFDDAGQPVVGQKGELVCTSPFPSMPLGFWNDPDGAAYRRAYFERYPGVWRHGDFAELTPRGGMIIYGRSDTVLNPGGVRIGTAEIYRQVEKIPEVLESVVVGQEWAGDVRVVLFVKLRPGAAMDDALRQRIRSQIRQGATPRHVPAVIETVADIPRTKSGKTVELAVREALHGRPVKNKEALANPEALACIEALRPTLAK